MDYKVLYRKYRPKNFDEIIGQDNSITLLKESLSNDHISHAYIFSGPRGTGKTSTAKILAKAINCQNKNGYNPCNECSNCLDFSHSSDIYEIDAASNNGVDQIREIIDNIKLAPINSKYKVYIIDEVHMLSTSAFNALLLTLEEPPSHVVFILATTNIENVPITVLSRCQRLDFRKINQKNIENNLKQIAENENIDITDEAINEIATYSDGGMRDALSILDQLSKINGTITQEVVLDNMGIISSKQISILIDNIEKSNVDGILNFVNNLRSISADYKSILKRIINALKQIAVDIKKNDYFGSFSYSDIKKMIFELSNTLYKSNVHIDSYTLLEIILLDYVNIKNLTNNSNSTINQHTEIISREIINKSSTDISQDNKTPANPRNKAIEIKNENSEIKKNYFPGNNFVKARINNCFVSANKKYLSKAKEYWNDFLMLVSDINLKGMLSDTIVVLSSENIMVIKTDYPENAELINENMEQIEEKIQNYLNISYKLVAIDENSWNNEINKFKENLKNNVKYTLMSEDANEEDVEVSDVFVKNKVEVK